METEPDERKKNGFNKLQKELKKAKLELKAKEIELKNIKKSLLDVHLKDLPKVYRATLEAYREEKEFAQSLVNTAQVIILVLDKNAKIVSINPFLEELSGYKKEEVVGKDWFDTFLPKKEHSKLKKIFQKAFSSINISGHINPIINKNGEEREIEWYTKTLKNAKGNAIGVLSLGADVTERMKIERQNEHLKEVLLAIRNINQLITQEKDLSKLIKEVCNCFTETRGFHYAWIMIMNDRKEVIKYAQSGLDDNFNLILKEYQNNKAPMCIKKALNKTNVHVTKTFSKECKTCACKHYYSENSSMTIRLEHNENIFGVMSVALPENFLVNKEEQELFVEAARDVSLSIYNIELDEKREKVEIALRNSELKYRTIFNSSHDGIYVFDRRGNLVEVNKTACNLHGRKKEEMLQMFPEEFIHSDTHQIFSEFKKTILDGEDFSAEFKGIHVDGSFFEAEVYGTGIEIDSELFLFSTLKNITEERKVQLELKKSEERFRLLAENASDVIFRMSLPDGKYQYISPSCLKIFGYNQEDFYKSPFFIKKIIHPNWRDYFKLQFDRLIKGDAPSSYEYQIQHKLGGTQWILQRNVLIKNKEGIIIAIEGIIHDITDRKIAEVALRRSEKKYRNFIDNTVVGVFRSTVEGNITFVNEALLRMFDYDNEEDFFIDGGLKRYKDINDRKKLIKLLLEKRYITNYEVEVITRKGKSIFININAILEGNEISAMAVNVTERVKAQKQLINLNKKLQENIKEYTNLFNNTGTATCLYGDDNIITLCNSKFEELTGYSREEIEGRTPWHRFVNKKELERMTAYHQQRSEQKGNPPNEYDFEFIDRHGQNKQIHLQIGINSYTKQRIASLIDITERKRMEQALIESENKFRTYIESSPTSIFIINKQRNFIFVNISACKLLKYSQKEFLNLSLDDILYKEEKQKIGKNLTEVLQSKSMKSEILFETKDKKKIYAIFETIRLSDNDIIAYCTDISKLKSIEKALIKAKNKAIESDRLKSAFLANMSHEIRTPMNGILGFAQLLKKKTIPDELKENYIDVINIKGNQLLQLISDIVDISKIEANQIDIDKNVFCLNKLLKDLEHFYKTLIEKEKKQIKLELVVSFPDEKSIIISDHVRIEQIITNLLSNALKFTEKGTIKFGYDLRDDGFIEFYVKDSGIGLSKTDQKIVFDRFVQAAKTEKKLKGGTGLGLAISKGFVELLGGEIWVRSELSKGTVFYFTIPHEKGANSKVKNKEEEIIEYDWKGKIILVAEDEDINYQLIEAIIEPTNADVIRASTGKDAVKKCKDYKLDAILMDIKMPVMNGLDATKEIRKKMKKIPIIAQTAYAMSTDAAECISAGCNEYVSKPIDPVILLNMLDKYLRD